MHDLAPTVTGLAAALTALSLALFGVDHYSLLYAMVGAFFALSHSGSMGRWRSISYVILSTLAGAVIGNAVNDYTGNTHRIMLVLFCLGGGLTAHILAALVMEYAPKFFEGLLKRAAPKR